MFSHQKQTKHERSHAVLNNQILMNRTDEHFVKTPTVMGGLWAYFAPENELFVLKADTYFNVSLYIRHTFQNNLYNMCLNNGTDARCTHETYVGEFNCTCHGKLYNGLVSELY